MRASLKEEGETRVMKKIVIRFERDPSLETIDVLIRASEQDDAVQALLEQISDPFTKTITVFDDAGNFKTLSMDEIILASTDGKRVNIITEHEHWHIRETMQNLEETLDPAKFVRISRYEIVNLSKVIRYDFTIAGTLRLELMGGMETWASRRCIPAIRKRLLRKG